MRIINYVIGGLMIAVFSVLILFWCMFVARMITVLFQ